jgi:eukaryotic-like serine/threonine-protein kinase
MHKAGVIHRDLKPENILVMDTSDLNFRLCVTDFGFACRTNDGIEILRQSCGTPSYIDPEVLRASRPFSPKSDIFSIASIFYSLVTAKRLFPGNTAEAVIFFN